MCLRFGVDVAVAPTGPLVWEPLYATGADLKKKKDPSAKNKEQLGYLRKFFLLTKHRCRPTITLHPGVTLSVAVDVFGSVPIPSESG